MKVEVFKQKNIYGEYTAQMECGENQVVIICNKSSERSRLMNEVKKVIKPPKK